MTKTNLNKSEVDNWPNLPPIVFLLRYDGPYQNFTQELIAKYNERFGFGSLKISVETKGEVEHLSIFQRLGLMTTIYQDSNLRNENLWPITPSQSEGLFRDGRLTNPKQNWENLGLVLYDLTDKSKNTKEHLAFLKTLEQHEKEIGLTKKDLEKRVIVINAGLQKDDSLEYGAYPVVLPGLTQFYTHETLEKVGGNFLFEGFGTEGGLPLLKQIKSQADNKFLYKNLQTGERVLLMPEETKDMGLRIMGRWSNVVSYAGDDVFVSGCTMGRIHFFKK